MKTRALLSIGGAALLAGRALIGCGGSDDDGAEASAGSSGGASSTASKSASTSTMSGGAGGGGSATGGGGSGPITTHPTNILVNGGFELGLSCYGEYEQPDGNGDYSYVLSTDAHSGSYALEIRCIGPSCATAMNNRAYVVSEPFHMPANQAYKLTYWSKCDAGADAFWYTESSSQMYLSQATICTGDWASNEVDFTAGATDVDGTFYFYNHSTGSLFLDDVVLTYADGSVPAHTVKYPGESDVKATSSGLTIDGKPFYALGFFDVPFDALGDAAAIPGVNTVVWNSADCFNTDREIYADKAYDLGLHTVPDFTTTARLATPAIFPAVMNAFAKHRAHVALYLADEPDQAYYAYSLIDPTVLGDETTAAHQGTSLPLLSDLQHAHYDPPAVDAPYSGAVDVYASEPYGDSLDGVTQSFVVFGAMAPRAVWLFDDSTHMDATNVVPKAWYGAVLGGRSQIYFTWGGADANNLAAEKQAISEVSQLADVLYATDVSSTVTAPTGIAFTARKAGATTYVIAVNPTTAPVTGDITVQGLAASTGQVMFENRSVSVSGGGFSDTFAAVSRHVYAF